MGSGPTIVRLARGGTSALDLDTEAGRAFLQERLAFYNKLCFFLSGGFFLVGALLMASGVAAPGEVSAAHERRASLLHAATLVVQLSAWVACSRGRRFSLSTLRAIDAAALVLGCLGFALQSVTASSPHVEQMGHNLDELVREDGPQPPPASPTCCARWPLPWWRPTASGSSTAT